MGDKSVGKYPKALREHLVGLMKPKQLATIDHKTESAILSLITQIVRDEQDYKRTIGKLFIRTAGERLSELSRYMAYKQRHEMEIFRGKLLTVPDNEKLPDNIKFDQEGEIKFFKLIAVLVKQSDENLQKLRGIKGPLTDYLENTLSRLCMVYSTAEDKSEE